MIDCAYIGDSIAVGLQQLDRQCEVHAKVGANTDFITRNFVGQYGGDYTIISMGSNWPDNPHNRENAMKLRKSLHSSQVIWILPYNRTAARVIREVAMQFNDSYVELSGIPSKDGLHPNYRIAQRRIDKTLELGYD